MLKKMNLLTLTILALTSLSLTACGTLNGAGQDIENAGESIQDAAK